MDTLKVAKRDSQASQHTAEPPPSPPDTWYMQSESRPPARPTSGVTNGDYLDAHLVDDQHPATYTQVRAVRVRARQPMDGLKVAKRDTQTP